MILILIFVYFRRKPSPTMMVPPNYRRNFSGKGPFQAPFDAANMGSEGEQLYQVNKLLFLYYRH